MTMRMRGTMLWFNAEKNLGALQTDEGERLFVAGDAFGRDEKPVGRCAGMAIEFEAHEGDVREVAFIQELSPRRARSRHRR